MVVTGTKEVLSRRKDYISKGIQLITRYKSSGLFRDNQINFLNIYLIRFYIADSMVSFMQLDLQQLPTYIIKYWRSKLIAAITSSLIVYHSNLELFHEIQSEMHKVDPQSRKLIYGVASLICDYFESDK